MARPIWTGALSFGLVNVPVGLYSATEDKAIHFNQFQAGTADRIRNKRVNERTGEEVEFADIVKGYDLGGGEYVILTPEELESAEPGRSRTIEIIDFVDLDDIDPVFFKSTYYLAPHGAGGEKAYALLRQAMKESNKVGVASFVFRTKEQLVAVRPDDRVLALETMYYADEVRDPSRELGTLPSEDTTFAGRELDAAKLLVQSMVAELEPEGYRDNYREKVMEMIERKARGETISTERPSEDRAPVVDLLAALEQSVAAAKERRSRAAEADHDAAGGQANATGPAPADEEKATSSRTKGRRAS